jgi:hypothetical protein
MAKLLKEFLSSIILQCNVFHHVRRHPDAGADHNLLCTSAQLPASVGRRCKRTQQFMLCPPLSEDRCTASSFSAGSQAEVQQVVPHTSFTNCTVHTQALPLHDLGPSYVLCRKRQWKSWTCESSPSKLSTICTCARGSADDMLLLQCLEVRWSSRAKFFKDRLSWKK